MIHSYRYLYGRTRPGRLLPWILALGLVGCGGGDMADLKSYVAEVKGRHRGMVDPLPEVKTVEPFVFRPEDLRDPFIPDEKSQEPEEEKVESGIRPDTSRPREELESYELDSLRMVGTVIQQGGLWGLVRANDGTIHRVRVGNYMGKNYGKIINIKENMIELVEIFSDSPGAWHERKASLDLAEASGGNK
ncbi:type IV pilus assembly protein PilP [Methylomagnum ishizawai]|uniref:Type IV pilus assembly protein PilP n=2 Tax=Methylomagnum ishizawai TaxID=1760988 RepID=A0A1Y6D174_9GAMM|nr:type IV pilus assembly protein PilP [Methylomagnum ishizawai]